MDAIISPISSSLIKAELSAIKPLRITNKMDNEVYVFHASECPNTLKEVGRLREQAFRAGGGGTGRSIDIDEFDKIEGGYKQLIVWSPQQECIVGGYRFINGADVLKHKLKTDVLATSHMFNYSSEFVNEILPQTLELGRSFVANEFQATAINTLHIYALDNLWDGLGALTVLHPNIKYFFGKVTMYKNYSRPCRNLILYFMKLYFDDEKNLVSAKHPLTIDIDEESKKIFVGDSMQKDFKRLKQEVRKYNLNIPPLFNAYINLSPDLLYLGTALNDEFGEVEETGILINIDQILEEKKKRHIESFKKTEGL